MRTSEINADAWAEGSLRSICEVQGASVDPWAVDAIDIDPMPTGSDFTICISAEVLRFELGECGVELADYKALVEFMIADLRDHRAKARQGYLTYLRHILRPPKRRGFFGRLLSAQSPVVPIQWHWVSMNSIALEEVVVRMTGTASHA